MLNRKIAISAVSIFAAFALIAGGTFAFFSDVATSTNNTFASGSLTLHLDDNNETVAPGVTSSIQLAGLAPGVGQTGFISLHNPNVVGAINIAEVEFGADITGTVDNGGGVLADVLNLTVMTGSDNTCTTNQVNHTNAIAAQIGNNALPLALSELSGTDYDALPGLNVTDTYFMCLTATMDSGAGDVYQGDSLTADFVFTANQNASQ